jgi:hypothetical protein
LQGSTDLFVCIRPDQVPQSQEATMRPVASRE